MAEFTIGAHTYQTGIMPARTQFHCARRLLVVLSSVASLMPSRRPDALPEPDATDAEPTAADFVSTVEHMATAISRLPDADCDFVLDACLAVTKRKVGQAWAPVWNANAKRLMYDDIDMAAMIGIAARALQENAAGFLAALPSLSELIAAG